MRELTGTTYLRIESFNDAADTDYALLQQMLEHVRITLIAGTSRRSLAQDIAYIVYRHLDRLRARRAMPVTATRTTI
jgi:hypothetical protein